jgi:hypothetical protein
LVACRCQDLNLEGLDQHGERRRGCLLIRSRQEGQPDDGNCGEDAGQERCEGKPAR